MFFCLYSLRAATYTKKKNFVNVTDMPKQTVYDETNYIYILIYI